MNFVRNADDEIVLQQIAFRFFERPLTARCPAFHRMTAKERYLQPHVVRITVARLLLNAFVERYFIALSFADNVRPEIVAVTQKVVIRHESGEQFADNFDINGLLSHAELAEIDERDVAVINARLLLRLIGDIRNESRLI